MICFTYVEIPNSIRPSEAINTFFGMTQTELLKRNKSCKVSQIHWYEEPKSIYIRVGRDVRKEFRTSVSQLHFFHDGVHGSCRQCVPIKWSRGLCTNKLDLFLLRRWRDCCARLFSSRQTLLLLITALHPMWVLICIYSIINTKPEVISICRSG